MRDIVLADTVFMAFTTRAFATGIPTVLAGTPVVSAYEDAGLTQITAGITLGVDHDTVAGLNMLTIVATGANGYEADKDYNLVITTGTVGGVSVVGEVVGQFSIQRAPVNWANVTDPTTALDLSGTDIQLVDTATTVTNQVTAAANADAVWDEDATGHQTGGTFGQAIGDPGANTETIYDGVVTDAAGTNIAADIIVIESQTDDIGVAGAGLTAINLPNQTMDITGDITGNLSGSIGSNTELGPAEVNAEVVDVIFTDTDAEPAKGAPGATISLADKIGFLYKAWRNRSTQTATTYSLFNDDATTVDHDATVSDDTTTADRGEMTDGP